MHPSSTDVSAHVLTHRDRRTDAHANHKASRHT